MPLVYRSEDLSAILKLGFKYLILHKDYVKWVIRMNPHEAPPPPEPVLYQRIRYAIDDSLGPPIYEDEKIAAYLLQRGLDRGL